MNPILFSHIPKTAGTSFRVALEEYFGEPKVLGDYGLDSERTSNIIKKWRYEQRDRFGLGALLNEYSALSGHVKLQTYLSLFPILHTLTFVREPVDRVISEFRHFQRHMGYQGSLMDFARNKRNINLQSRYLANTPLGSIGFVGLSEHYKESLELINQQFSLELPELDLNKAPSECVSLSHDEKVAIRRLNKKDMRLYRHARKLFSLRKKTLSRSDEYVFGGWRKLVKSHVIRGYAWHASNVNEPVQIEVSSENERWNCQASDIAELSKMVNVPRHGFVGFQLKLPKPVDMSQLTVRVGKTGQILLPEDYL